MQIDRSFVRLAEGLVHVRSVAARSDSVPPLLMLHASPSSSVAMEPIMQALYRAGYPGALVAPDTLGNGDSAPPDGDAPDIAYFADALRRLVDTLGYTRINLFGVHTGARIACEFTAAHPERVAHTALSGITEYEADLRDAILAHYAPRIEPDEYGRQFVWAFQFTRDQSFHFPYFMRDPAHRLATTMPSPRQLHVRTLDVLKALDTYHKPYLAAFRYPSRARFADITTPTLLLCPDTELPNLRAASLEFAGLSPAASRVEIGPGDAALADAIWEFMRHGNGG